VLKLHHEVTCRGDMPYGLTARMEEVPKLTIHSVPVRRDSALFMTNQ
jgi:hypothetical protein